MLKNLLLTLVLLLVPLVGKSASLFVEAESFQNIGGWVVDNQAAAQMGSPYLMAHGMGVAVDDASTTITVKRSATYRVWVRTRDWARTWGETASPGKFQLTINGKPLATTFGTEGAEWHWQDGGTISLTSGKTTLALHDLTGFNGRCDAIYLTTNLSFTPPHQGTELQKFRAAQTSTGKPRKAGHYDLVVVGGGMAGCCAAVSAARLGCKVALIQNRPVLGGNNSSEIRVGAAGLIFQQPYSNLGKLLDELNGIGYWNNQEALKDSTSPRSRKILEVVRQHPEKLQHNGGPASNYDDDKKLRLLQSEKNISLFLNTNVYKASKKGSRITSVTGKNILTGEETTFSGTLFADCTGDGNLGFLAGADYRMGRESKSETLEPRAPEKADSLVMGTSVQWYAEETKASSAFPDCPWALQFNDSTCQPLTRGDWDWETGLNLNQITQTEYIRDYALRAIYGNWAYLKNHYRGKAEYARQKLAWVAYIGGKRESRRILGDIILKEQDILEQKTFDDASFTTTWGVDLHYPKKINGFGNDPFLAYCDVQYIQPYAVPYRCLYSRNVENMFMAGRNISVTHVALGTVRVMRTGGMMGEVVGMAASLCRKFRTTPREIYKSHLPELKTLMTAGTPTTKK